MFHVGALKKFGVLLCLGLMVFATFGWSKNEKADMPDVSLREIGMELILSLAPIIYPDWLCWLIEKEKIDKENNDLLKPSDDMGIVKISL